MTQVPSVRQRVEIPAKEGSIKVRERVTFRYGPAPCGRLPKPPDAMGVPTTPAEPCSSERCCST